MNGQPDTFYATRGAHEPMTYVVRVLGDCGAVHGSVEDWQKCPLCERNSQRPSYGQSAVFCVCETPQN